MQAILLIGKAQQRPGVPLGKVMRAQPVSYTHLDVYKRQVMG